jgi:hypothetical protein
MTSLFKKKKKKKKKLLLDDVEVVYTLVDCKRKIKGAQVSKLRGGHCMAQVVTLPVTSGQTLSQKAPKLLFLLIKSVNKIK